MIKNLSANILLCKTDLYLLRSWITRHDIIAEHIIIACDGPLDIPDFVYNCKSHVNIIETPLNNNFAGARNKIIEYSTEIGCDYSLFLDADELLLPNNNNGIVIRPIIDYMNRNMKIDFLSFLRFNFFEHILVDFPDYHNALVRNTAKYINNSPERSYDFGCHETVVGYGPNITDLQILHLKDKWDGNFRAKGYKDVRQKIALDDLQTKIDKING